MLMLSHGSKFGAIIKCALGDEDGSNPEFIGRAVISKEGFVYCDFIDADGRAHPDAFVGAVSDPDGNVAGLSTHLQLNERERGKFEVTIRDWINTDYRERR
jgi:hypothetical protein